MYELQQTCSGLIDQQEEKGKEIREVALREDMRIERKLAFS